MNSDGCLKVIVCMLLSATSGSFTVVNAAPGAWADPAGDVTLANADILSGSATVFEGMVDLRVQLAAPPFPTNSTHFIDWCLDTDRSTATGDACGASVFLGADEGFNLDGGLGALETCDFVIGGNGLELDPFSHLWYDPATHTLRLLFPLSLISEEAAFNYVVLSTSGASGGSDYAPDSAGFAFPDGFFTSDVAELPPFNGILWCGREPIAIDIRPGTLTNSVNPRSNGVIPVAVLTTDAFDAATLDPATVLFGATGTEAAPVLVALNDVDQDGDADLILHFETRLTGLACGDPGATLTGLTFGRQGIMGSDSVRTLGCDE